MLEKNAIAVPYSSNRKYDYNRGGDNDPAIIEVAPGRCGVFVIVIGR
jgi:hypothetical protein